MSTALHLAGPADLDRLSALVADFHASRGMTRDEATLGAGLMPLLAGSPHGAAYLMGPARAPIGYVVVTFGWSLEFGGLDALIDEIYIRPAVRGRGIAREVLTALPGALGRAGIRAIHLEIGRDDAESRRFYARAGFVARENALLMTRVL